MIRAFPRLFVVTAAVTAALAVACAGRRIRQPEMPGQAMVVLLPDPGTGKVGRAFVTTAAGAVELSSAREATFATSRAAPEPVRSLSQRDVDQLFGDVLAALPPAERHYTLYFEFDSEALTRESRALATDIVRSMEDTPAPDVLVVGHTDTTGPRDVNFALGLRRANTVAVLLRDAGVDPAFIDAISHGESELLVPTADDVFEPKNRRVEVTVR